MRGSSKGRGESTSALELNPVQIKMANEKKTRIPRIQKLDNKKEVRLYGKGGGGKG